MSRTGVLVAIVASAAGCVLVVAVALLAPAGRTPPASPPPLAPADRTGALEALREWDAARLAAWQRADGRALRALYTGESRSGLADRRLLAAYDARGLRVRDLGVQRAAVAVVRRTDHRLVLLVTDRLTDGWVLTRDGERVSLPRDRWSTRQVVLVARGGDWRVVEVRDSAGRVPRPAPR